jgi:hypothetical protein
VKGLKRGLVGIGRFRLDEEIRLRLGPVEGVAQHY